VSTKQPDNTTLLVDKHKKYIHSLEEEKKDSFEYWTTEHLRVSGIYWGFTGIDVLNCLHEMDKEKTLQQVLVCQKPNGGFAGNKDHDAHLLYTLSAVQVLVMLDSLDKINSDLVAKNVASLQNEDGSFCGDEWGEVDTRFSYCAVSTLSLLGKLEYINIDKTIDFILQCKNFDEAFGCVPGAESHAGQTFCCVGALAILGALDKIDKDLLGWWLAERQVKEGGLNGRPEKLPDVCYSWWVLSCLGILGKLDWIDKSKLITWILNCQDIETGGFADRPGDWVDVYHTCFGLTGLSLLGHPGLAAVDPRYCMTEQCLKKLPARSNTTDKPKEISTEKKIILKPQTFGALLRVLFFLKIT